MSKQISPEKLADPSKLSQSEVAYLESRGQLPPGVRGVLRSQAPESSGLGLNTGDVGTAVDDAFNEAQTARIKAEQDVERLTAELDVAKATIQAQEEALVASEELPEAYEDWTKKQLMDEISVRNDLGPEEKLKASGTKEELIAILVADDGDEEE